VVSGGFGFEGKKGMNKKACVWDFVEDYEDENVLSSSKASWKSVL
jgi:hypothetical protein